jgi:hypothetical protein
MKRSRTVGGTEATAVPQLETNRDLVAEQTTHERGKRACRARTLVRGNT